MRVAIVGSRGFPAMSRVAAFVATLGRDTVVHNGTAKGVDSYTALCARSLGLSVVDFPADWNTHGRKAGVLRNQQMLAKSDQVVAFWDGNSRGTWDMVNRATAEGKLWFVCLPSGQCIQPDPFGNLFQKIKDALAGRL